MIEATQIVHWPGKSTPMCDKHAEQAKQLAVAMGFVLNCFWIPPHLRNQICANCENETFVAITCWLLILVLLVFILAGFIIICVIKRRYK